MEATILLTTLLTIFATDLQSPCDSVYLGPSGAPLTDALGQTFSRFCEWTGPQAPVWDDDVCCTIDNDGASCTESDARGGCEVGELMYCEYGEAIASGVVCYQPFEGMCENGLCIQAPEEPPPVVANLACCWPNSGCVPLAGSKILDCIDSGGSTFFCYHGQTNSDGTITCYD